MKIALAILLLTAGASGAAEPPFSVSEGLFDPGQPRTLGLKKLPAEHASLYRATPETFRFCHHANLVVFGGRLYCMWSNGKIGEDEPGQRILFANSRDGVTWSSPRVLATDPLKRGACVAAGFRGTGKRLIAFYTVSGGTNFHAETALWARESTDAVSWGAPRRLVAGFYIRAPISLPGGGLFLSGEHVGKERETKRMRLLVTQREDGLGDWQDARIRVTDPKVFGYTEPAAYVRRDGAIVCPFRNYSGALFGSLSTDRGRSWSVPVRTNFPDSLARHDTGRLPDQSYYLINNPSSKRLDRSILTLATSRDGVIFDRAWIVRNEPTRMRFQGKSKLDGWQYPHARAWRDHLYVAYTINKEDVGVTRISLRTLAAP